jgi:hypothetical protein
MKESSTESRTRDKSPAKKGGLSRKTAVASLFFALVIAGQQCLGPATTLYGAAALSFVIPSAPGFPTSPLSSAITYLQSFSSSRTPSATNRWVPQVSLLRPGIRATNLEWKPQCPIAIPSEALRSPIAYSCPFLVIRTGAKHSGGTCGDLVFSAYPPTNPSS